MGGRTVPLKPLKQSSGRGRSASRGDEDEISGVVQFAAGGKEARRKSWGIDSTDDTLKARFDLTVQSLSLNSDGNKEQGSLTSRERSHSMKQPNKQEISREQVMTWKKVDKPQRSDAKRIHLQSKRQGGPDPE